MNKDIILELQRIKSLMGKKENVFEQTFQEYIQYDNPEMTNSPEGGKNYFEDKKTFNIGKGTNYPFIIYFNNKEYDTLPVVEGTKIFTIQPGMTSKDFIPNTKVGTIKDDLGKEHPNQEYIEKEVTVKELNKTLRRTLRLCLPDKTFWNLDEHIGKVWKFETPVSSQGGMFSAIEDFSKTFAMSLSLKDTSLAGTGWNASVACRGGDNGWGWEISTQPIFFNVENGKPYNPKNPQDLDTRSDWETWYDHYGMWLEIGIGIAATFVGAGFATLILELAEAAATAGRLAGFSLELYEFVSAAYGTTTRLSVFMQMLAEGIMMSPIISWQISDDRDADGWLSAIFLFLPLLTELKGVGKLIGGRYSREAAETLATKIQNAGLESIYRLGIDSPEGQATFSRFIISLTGTELALWQRGMSIMGSRESMETVKQGIEELISTGGQFYREFSEAELKGAKESFLGKLGNIIGGENAAKWGNKASKFVAKNINPVTARWVLPFHFVRMGVPITIFATSFKVGYNELTQEEKVKFEENYEKSLIADKSYFEALNSIDPYWAEYLANKQLEILTENPDKCRELAQNSDFFNTEEGKKIKDQATQELIDEKIANSTIPPKDVQVVTNATTSFALKQSTVKLIKEFFKGFGFTEIKMVNTSNVNNVLGTLKFEEIKYDFETKKENDVVKYYVGTKLITDQEIKDAKWDPTHAKPSYTPEQQNELFHRKKDIIRNIYR